MMKDSKKKLIKWHIYDKSGLRFVCEKYKPLKEREIKRKPSTLMLWIISIYLAFYGVTSTRYENYIDRIENRANIIVSQLGNNNYKNSLSMISSVQRRKCPYQPILLKPWSVFFSWMGNMDKPYAEVVVSLRTTIEVWRDSLSGVKLSHANLESAFLKEGKFVGSFLPYTNFKWTNLINADFKAAQLFNANLRFARLWKTNFENAYLNNVDFSNDRLTNPSGNRDETKEDILNFIKELESAKSVERIKLDDNILEIIEEEFPDLLKRINDGEPPYTKENN